MSVGFIPGYTCWRGWGGVNEGVGCVGTPSSPPKTWTSFVSLAAAQHRDLIEVGLGWWLPGGPWGVHLALHQAAEHEQGGGGVGSLGDDRVGGQAAVAGRDATVPQGGGTVSRVRHVTCATPV